jgi:hypothetical protein
VGALRWQPPQPAARWSGVRDASAFAPRCAQPPSPFGGGTGSEDCFYLNVFTPSGEARDGQAQRMQSLNTPAPAVERDFATSHQCAFWALAGARPTLVQM